MPSLMASIGLDATRFNAGAANVIAKSKQLGKDVANAGKTSTTTALGGGAGLASDPAAFIGAEAREKEMSRRRAQTMAAHEVWLAKKNAATKAAADKEKAIYGDLDRYMSKKGAKAELFKEMGFVPLAGGAEKLAKGAEKAAASTSALGGALKMTGVLLAVDFLKSQAESAIKYGGKVADLSDHLGVSTTAIQQWDHALQLNGASIDDASKFFERLAMSREKALQGDGEMIQNFKALGVSVEDLKGKRLEDIGLQIGKAFETGDPQLLLADLREVGGKGAGELITAFSQGMEQLFKGVPIIPPDAIEQLDAIGDKFTEIAASFKSGMAQAVVGLVEGISAAVEWYRTGMAGAIGFVQGLLTGDSISRAKENMQLYREGTALEKQDKAVLKSKKKTFVGGGEESETASAKKKKQSDFDRAWKEGIVDEVNKEAAKIKEESDFTKAAATQHSATSLQQMGGFLGNFAAAAGPEVALLNTQVKSEQHLAEIKKLLMAQHGYGKGPETVDY